MNSGNQNPNRTSPKGGYVANEGRTDYVVKNSRRTNIIALILSFFAAVVLWSYVTINQQEEMSQVVFNALDLDFVGQTELKNQTGLIVQSVSEQSLSISMTGKVADVQKLSSSSIRLYVDLTEQNIVSAGVYEFPIHLDVPEGFECSPSAERVRVEIDKPDTKVLEVDRENIQLSGLVRETGCTIIDRSVNITKVTLEGNTANLARVAGIQIRTDAIGMISNSHLSVPAHVYLLDDKGKDLDLPVTVTTDCADGVIEVSLVAYLEKEVELTVDLLGDYFKNSDIVRITPAKVRVYGEFEQVNRLGGKLSLLLPEADYVIDGKLNEKLIPGDLSLTELGLSLPSGAEGLMITQVDGASYAGASLEIRVSELRTEILQISKFDLGGISGYSIAEESLSVRFRATGSSELDMLISEQDQIVLRVNFNSYDPQTGKAAVVVLLPDAYRGSVYEVGSYEISLVPVPATGE